MARMMEAIFAFVTVFSCFHLLVDTSKAKLPGMLFPRDSESREVKDLSGFWNFRADLSANRNAGFEQNWFAKPLWQVGNGLYYSEWIKSTRNPNFQASRPLNKLLVWMSCSHENPPNM